VAGNLLSPPAVMVETARGRLTAFLVARMGRNFCDACAAKALGIDPSTAYRAAAGATRDPGFVREYALCSDCGASRLVTRAAG
jgi:hypothetical protein